jgi:hypothetical protein
VRNARCVQRLLHAACHVARRDPDVLETEGDLAIDDVVDSLQLRVLEDESDVAREVLHSERQPTAAFCFSDSIAYGVYTACQELGLGPEEAIRGATIGGARALRLQRQCGSIRLGKRCDLLLVDAESYLDIPYRLGVNLVQTTICLGKPAAGQV